MAGERKYKRSWKNLLINKRYQLRFTLFMVGLSTLLMTGLGIWIMIVANETTKVAITSERGKSCPKVPAIQAPYEEVPDAPPPSMKLPDAPTPDAPDGARKRPKIDVTLDEMEMAKPVQIVPPVPGGKSINFESDGPTHKKGDPDPASGRRFESDGPIVKKGDPNPKSFGRRVVDHWTCELGIVAKAKDLEASHTRILMVLIAACILLVVGLAIYGIKMTHKVAGPLFKVQLYLAKMKEGRFDKVWNLRKGDQLVEFYDHFKQAHAGVVALETSDIERLKKAIAAAESAGAGDHPSIVELRTMLERKEKSVE
ncbi:MAG: hypothetical protein H0V17_12295 [Deltaproteobacteria bacterium]|nr:hypothetical protein [Deltaproteobacteria bacterium]